MKTVICKSGAKGWQARLQENYTSLEEFKNYCEIYGIHTRLGYETPEQAWKENKVVEGSTNPSDFRVVLKDSEKDKRKTRVMLLYNMANDDLFAYFPDVKSSTLNPNERSCYSHVGQHSGCSREYAAESKPAELKKKGAECPANELIKELESIGYNLLVVSPVKLSVRDEITQLEYHRNPTPSELKFGYGATHYKSFLIKECCKPGRVPKQWFTAEDGLRYYRK